MSVYQVVRLLDCHCERLFEVAADIERYPEFLPGWEAVRVIERVDNRLQVEQRLGLPAFSEVFTSTAHLYHPERVHIHSSDGPFRDLQIEWRFAPCAAGQCQVSFRMEYRLASRLLGVVAERAIGLAASDVVERFRSRVLNLYGCGYLD